MVTTSWSLGVCGILGDAFENAASSRTFAVRSSPSPCSEPDSPQVARNVFTGTVSTCGGLQTQPGDIWYKVREFRDSSFSLSCSRTTVRQRKSLLRKTSRPGFRRCVCSLMELRTHIALTPTLEHTKTERTKSSSSGSATNIDFFSLCRQRPGELVIDALCCRVRGIVRCNYSHSAAGGARVVCRFRCTALHWAPMCIRMAFAPFAIASSWLYGRLAELAI